LVPLRGRHPTIRTPDQHPASSPIGHDRSPLGRAAGSGRGLLVAERVAYALWLDQNDLHDEARKWWAGLAAVRPEQGSLRARACLERRRARLTFT